jgi:hypothetical protein
VFLTLKYPNPGGHPLIAPEIVQSSPSHALWRGEPDETLYYGYEQAAKLAARAETPHCSVIRRDDGREFSYGDWWPYALRLNDGMVNWPRLSTIHTFVGDNPGRMIIAWGSRHHQAVVTFERPQCATEVADVTYGEIQRGAIEDMVRDRGWRVIAQRGI